MLYEISPAWQRMNVNALTLLAQVECRRENFSKAIDQLSQCSDSHQLNTTMVSNYNNLACVHYNYGNPGLAKVNQKEILLISNLYPYQKHENRVVTSSPLKAFL